MSLSNLHPSIQNKDLGAMGADIITRNLFQQIENTAERYEPQNVVWENDVLSALRLCKGVERGSQSAQAYILAIIQDHWDDMSIEFRKQYDFQFSILVLRETDVQPSTMDNYTRAARLFFGEGKKPLGQVEITKYDAYKRPIKSTDGGYEKESVPFDPATVSITKLALAAPLARKDALTPRLWNMLADQEISPDSFKKELYKPVEGENTPDHDPSLRFTLEGDRIVATEYGESIEIGELYFDNGSNDLGRTAIRRLLMILQVPHEDDVIGRMIQCARDRQLLRIYETGGEALLSKEQEE